MGRGRRRAGGLIQSQQYILCEGSYLPAGGFSQQPAWVPPPQHPSSAGSRWLSFSESSVACKEDPSSVRKREFAALETSSWGQVAKALAAEAGLLCPALSEPHSTQGWNPCPGYVKPAGSRLFIFQFHQANSPCSSSKFAFIPMPVWQSNREGKSPTPSIFQLPGCANEDWLQF